jgi:hypothetical protein
MSFGSRDEVVFMLHVNLSERGFTDSSLFDDLIVGTVSIAMSTD